MFEWFGVHRGLYSLLVLLFFVLFWVATGLDPVRRLITVWNDRVPAPEELARDLARKAGFTVLGLFLIAQVALASQHVRLSDTAACAIWLLCAFAIPVLTHEEVRGLIRRRGNVCAINS